MSNTANDAHKLADSLTDSLTDAQLQEKLISFGLPKSFPPEVVPVEVSEFIARCKPGMTVSEAVWLAEELDLNPTLKPLQHMGDNVYGFGVDVKGFVVPLMIKTSKAVFVPAEVETRTISEEPSPAQLANACIWIRHDYGLLSLTEQETLRTEVRRYWTAIFKSCKGLN